jgi:hypothetical protein
LVKTISYDQLKNDPIGTCQVIVDRIGIEIDAEKIVARFQSGKRRIANYNVGEAGRFDAAASLWQKELVDQVFSEAGWPFHSQ